MVHKTCTIKSNIHHLCVLKKKTTPHTKVPFTFQSLTRLQRMAQWTVDGFLTHSGQNYMACAFNVCVFSCVSFCMIIEGKYI